MNWKPADAASRIFVALDGFESFGEMASFVRQLAPLGVKYKARNPLFWRFGAQALNDIGLCGPDLFADVKLNDIGNSAAEDLNTLIKLYYPGFVTCHLSGSSNMLKSLSAIATGTATNPVGVSILTDMDEDDCYDIYEHSPDDMVNFLAERALEHHMRYLVCSPREIAKVKKRHPDIIGITPAIRAADAPPDDQQRTATASQAIADGADYLVIGRPITKAPDPVAAAKAFIEEVATATPA